MTDGRKITHTYNGAGALLRTVYSTGETWDYNAGVVYKNNAAYQMATPEGRYLFAINDYEFDYKDHLGNTRLSFKAEGNKLVKTSETAFDPWGLVLNGIGQKNTTENRWELQGKEKESTFGLNRIGFGARTYNATIGRFDRVDPLAHKYPSLSPYCYVANNPILYVDPDGREIWIAFDVVNKDGSTTQQKVQYKDGALFGTNGKAYTGGNEYATKVMGDLNQLSKDNTDLGGRITTLQDSKNIHTIKMTANADDGNANSPISQSDDEKGISTGSNTTYNPDKETNVRGDKRVARAGLAHELLGHGYDSDQGKADYTKTDNGIPMYEVNAVNMENRARAAAGNEKKTTYGGKPIPEKLLDDTHKKKE